MLRQASLPTAEIARTMDHHLQYNNSRNDASDLPLQIREKLESTGFSLCKFEGLCKDLECMVFNKSLFLVSAGLSLAFTGNHACLRFPYLGPRAALELLLRVS
jgi:hypothetical protein